MKYAFQDATSVETVHVTQSNQHNDTNPKVPGLFLCKQQRETEVRWSTPTQM